MRDRRVPLEMCPTSNVHTGAAASIDEHPFGLLRRLRFRVTVNTDNRLMSHVTLSEELEKVARGVRALRSTTSDGSTINAMKSAFCHFEDRLRIIEGTIKPGFSLVATETGTALTGI